MARTILIQPEAPPKPATGQPCNGCGLCCLAEPCPVGVLVSLKRQGSCRALQWSAPDCQYRCGMLVQPARYLGLPRLAPGAWPNRLIARWARRMIAAGIGCDAELEVETESAIGNAAPSPHPSAHSDTTPDNR